MGKKRNANEDFESEENHQSNNGEAGEELSSEVKPKKKKRRRRKKACPVKDPKEAQSYLSLWQQQQKEGNNDAALWKFNKNTQSWLIRNMYDVEKLPKGSFSILISYLEGLKGASRQRVQEDAMSRALRYKDWEKNKQSSETEKIEADANIEQNQESVEKNSNQSNTDNDDEDNEETEERRWKSLGDSSKRKEYKRARKIIDTMKKDSKE